MKKYCIHICLLLITATSLFATGQGENPTKENKKIFLAILARNKAHVLDKFLKCIHDLDYNKKLITIYINTNNNTDKSKEILENWVAATKDEYAQVIFENHEIQNLGVNAPHDWTVTRLNALSKIRNDSFKKTKEYGCDYYFVVDCDNFIKPFTLKELIAKDKPMIAPLLRAVPEPGDAYSNYFCDVTETGFYKKHADYFKILNHEMVGTFKVPVVHCTYLIKAECLDKLTYVDGSNGYDFIILSTSARKNNVDQFICNEKDFGTLIHFYTEVSLEEEQKRVQDILPTL